MATVAMGLLPKRRLGFRSVIAASSSSTGLSILVKSYGLLVGSVTAPDGGRRACNFELGVTLVLLLQSIIPSDQHPVVHIGSYEVW